MSGRRTHRPSRGAAMLLALLIMTLIATLASGMVWQQWRAIRIEAAERARTQAAWILLGALDWARLILREDARPGGPDHLGEPWAVPLAEARLSSFLAADRDNTTIAENDSLDAFLSGSITDAQARWNLWRVVDENGKVVPAALKVLQRLCEAAGAPGGSAESIAAALQLSMASATGAREDATVEPKRLEQLVWLGIDPGLVKRLDAYVVLLPRRDTRVNVNTASAEVIAAMVEGMSLGNAQRLVQDRSRQVVRDVNAAPARAFFPPDPQTSLGELGTASRFFVVQGRLRLGDRVLEERSLVERRQPLDVVVVQRERLNLREGP
jgi:general secretion pathway protein K